MNYKSSYNKIYTPRIGAIYKAPNKIWTNKFASKNDPNQLHPSLLEKIKSDGLTAMICPGTTSKQKNISCTYTIELNNNGIKSYFLLNLSMPYIINDLLKLKQGWNGKKQLNNDQLKDFHWQSKICKG